MGEVTINTDDLISVVEAAKLLHRPRITIYRWIEQHKINAVKFGGVLFIPREEIEKKIKTTQGIQITGKYPDTENETR